MNKTAAAIIALAGWFVVIMQFFLLMQVQGVPRMELVIRFFSYFTILTNILVAVMFTMAAFSDNTFFTRPGVQTAITVYIIVVGLIYNLVLRFLWSPQGMQRFTDELLHTIIPVSAVVYWVKYVRKDGLVYRNCFLWLLFPFAYILFVALRGAASGFYPYPFIDVTRLGYPRALLNGLGMVLIFMGLSLFLTAIGQWLKHRQPLNR